MNSFQNASIFLIRTLFDLYIFLVALRVVLHGFEVNFYNPFCQTIVKWTSGPLKLLRVLLPSWRYFDVSVIVFLLLLEMAKFSLLFWIQTRYFPSLPGLFVIASADMLSQLLDILFYAVLIVLVLSWVNPQVRNPMIEILFSITMPLFNLVRRITPTLGGIDLAPALVLIILKLLDIVLVKPLFASGLSLLIL